MNEPSNRPGCGQWLLLGGLALWLAGVPLVVSAVVSALAGYVPTSLVQLGLAAPGSPALPEWAVGLLATLLTLGLHLLVFVPVYLAGRRPGREFLRASAALLIGTAVYLMLNALARLPWPENPTRTAALRLTLTLPFLLLVLPRLLPAAEGMGTWRAIGLRRWTGGSALWLALAAAAVIVGAWVLVGSLGSAGTTAANALQALPNALGEEILFRGIALAWLWRVLISRAPSAPGGRDALQAPGANRWLAAAGCLVLYVAAQGGTVLPCGDWNALLRFGAALFLGLLFTELTVRAGGSIWPAVLVHFLYDWFHLAFVDPRSQAEILHWLALGWAVLAAGGLGFLLWLGRKVVGASRETPARARGGPGLVAAAALAVVAWAVVALLYVTLGAPGFHPDGFLIYLDEQADLAPAAAIAGPVERRAWVYQALVETAERSQAPLRAELDRRGVSYRPHYLVNMIEVPERPGLRRAMAKQPGVDSVLFQPGVRPYPRGLPLPNLDPAPSTGVEWNVSEIGADQAWAAGYTGQGIIVGNADTGVEWDHPALLAAYLGWDGGSADHNYHWYDPWEGHTEPFDDSGHGTHTTGTMLGQDGETKIGIAPGARWIACRNMRRGLGNPGAYVSCMEFLLAPFPLGGDPLRDGDPARGAHVVNNSWGCPDKEGCQADTLRIAVDHLRAAGQMMVASAGNEGPSCSTVTDPPALYDSAFTVGAISQGDQVTGFSSRGPVAADGSDRIKPDIVAPGDMVRSSMPGGYGVNSGTSMAGPHVAGAVALLWSAEPALIGDIDRTESLLVETAQWLTVDAVCARGTVCACGGDLPGTVPNNVYGWGEVDVWAALQKLLAER